ncbi:hypothetical protein [Streptomyces sp. NPDC058701]|uniref:hypothetical protein n=1 Tax=Streptomyces sp. NPDC058701 TaxID=3346608 RepID=UPI003651CE82
MTAQMSLMNRLPTTLWIVGATVAVAAFSPVVGNAVTDPTPGAVAVQPAAPPAAPEGDSALPPSGAPVLSPGPQDPSGAPDDGAPDPAAPSSADARGTTIAVVDSALGRIAVDGKGRTLYMSTLDSPAPPISVCLSAECLTAWKPLTLKDAKDKPSAGEGVEAGAVGSFRRTDGTWQATLGGWPVYWFAQDTRPGDVKGQGLKGTWYVLSPAGKKITIKAS